MRTSAVIEWDASGEEAARPTRNEIDVMCVAGTVPVFISCKMASPSPLALSEIEVLCRHFGGEAARAVVVTAADPRRAEQMRLAQAARTGQIPHITSAMIEEQRLAAAARRAEEQRLASQGVHPSKMAPVSAASASPAFVQPAAETQPAAAPAPQQSAKEQWVHAWQVISLDDDVPAAPAAQPVRPRIPHAQPVHPIAQPAAQSTAQSQQTRQPAAPPITWPSQPVPSKYYVTGQMPVVTDEMIEAAKRAAQDAQAAQH